MKKEEPERTSWGSMYSLTLSKGCQQCIVGEKMVVLVSSKCSSNCFYCPLSIERKKAGTAFANERPFQETADLLSEADNMTAKGASMTGGDPLELHSFNDTLKYCKILKKRYSNDFHIHAYTRGKDLTAELLTQIVPYLDEIRFHVINPEKDFIIVGMAIKFNLDIGIEIPVIPTKGFTYYINLIREFEKLVSKSSHFHFINLNELEISETNYRKLLKHDLEPDSINLSAIKGSSDLAVKIVEWASENS
ncbi:MAG: 4Fe-4S cluster-binding domain-containing protein, partial [Candidatus Hodarchaeales archaeon]